jgi:hypothetical protein
LLNTGVKIPAVEYALVALHLLYDGLSSDSIWQETPMFRINHPGVVTMGFFPNKSRKEDELVTVTLAKSGKGFNVTVFSR